MLGDFLNSLFGNPLVLQQVPSALWQKTWSAVLREHLTPGAQKLSSAVHSGCQTLHFEITHSACQQQLFLVDQIWESTRNQTKSLPRGSWIFWCIKISTYSARINKHKLRLPLFSSLRKGKKRKENILLNFGGIAPNTLSPFSIRKFRNSEKIMSSSTQVVETNQNRVGDYWLLAALGAGIPNSWPCLVRAHFLFHGSSHCNLICGKGWGGASRSLS